MTNKTKKTLIISLIVFLFLINISAITTIFYHKSIAPPKPTKENFRRDDTRKERMHHFIKEELKLDDDQFDKFQKINKRNWKNVRDITHQLDSRRDELLLEITKDNPDTTVLKNIAEEIGELHKTLKISTIHHFLELKEICNPEQQKILHKMYYGLLSQDNPMHRPYNRRNPKGRGEHRRKGR